MKNTRIEGIIMETVAVEEIESRLEGETLCQICAERFSEKPDIAVRIEIRKGRKGERPIAHLRRFLITRLKRNLCLLVPSDYLICGFGIDSNFIREIHKGVFKEAYWKLVTTDNYPYYLPLGEQESYSLIEYYELSGGEVEVLDILSRLR